MRRSSADQDLAEKPPTLSAVAGTRLFDVFVASGALKTAVTNFLLGYELLLSELLRGPRLEALNPVSWPQV